MAPTDPRLGEPLPHQLPNQPPTYPLALLLRERTFQYQSPIRVYRQFPNAVPDQRGSYRRVTEQSASVLRPYNLHG